MARVNGSIAIQDSLAPVYVVTFTGQVSDEKFQEYLAALSALIEGKGQRALVYDARLAVPAPASQRRMQAEWMKRHEAAVRRSTAGIAFVIPAALVRGVLTAILWVQPLPCPHHVSANFDEGFRWALRKLEPMADAGASRTR